MKSLIITFVCGLLSCSYLVTQAFGQDTTQTLNLVQTALSNTIALHNQVAGAQLRLYNGSIYEGFQFNFENGHPYFYSKEPGKGDILYDGILYKNVPIWYDLLSDKVIIEHYDEASQLSLIREKITYFKLHNHTFIYLPRDSVVNFHLSEGFYDQLYRGNITLLAKRTMQLEQRALPSGIERTLRRQVRYYLKKDNQYYSFKKQRALIKILADKKKELQQYIKQNNLRDEEKETALVKIAAYYHNLQN